MEPAGVVALVPAGIEEVFGTVAVDEPVLVPVEVLGRVELGELLKVLPDDVPGAVELELPGVDVPVVEDPLVPGEPVLLEGVPNVSEDEPEPDPPVPSVEEPVLSVESGALEPVLLVPRVPVAVLLVPVEELGVPSVPVALPVAVPPVPPEALPPVPPVPWANAAPPRSSAEHDAASQPFLKFLNVMSHPFFVGKCSMKVGPHDESGTPWRREAHVRVQDGQANGRRTEGTMC